MFSQMTSEAKNLPNLFLKTSSCIIECSNTLTKQSLGVGHLVNKIACATPNDYHIAFSKCEISDTYGINSIQNFRNSAIGSSVIIN